MEDKGKKAKHSPTGSWYKMPRELTLSNEIDPYQYRVLAILLDRGNLHQSTKGKTWFSCYLNWIVSHSGMGKTKVRQTLNELERKGFITITRRKDTRLPNQFHINWDYINSYKRPLTQQELEGLEDPEALEEDLEVQQETEPVATPALDSQDRTAPIKTRTLTLDDLDVDLDATLEDRKQPCPDTSTQPTAYDTTSVQSSTLPSAAEWYQSVGKTTLYEKDFPYLYGLTHDKKNELVFGDYVSGMMDKIIPQVKEDNAWSVWENVVSPGFSEYMKEQKRIEYEQSV